MSYLVLARKYRPGSFDEIVGQAHVVRTLKNAIRLNRVHHAFLFTGARGVGKTTTARVLARALNCEKGPTQSPCGQCSVCKEIASGVSPDVLEIDGASNRGVDSVRELRETVRYMPSRGRLKLYIIDEVHQLTSEAFNALLKTLEEPPEHVKFIFATTEPQKIPATILSRCQRFDFRRVSIPVLTEHLRGILAKEGATLGPQAVAAVVREAQGSVRDALSLLDQVLSYAGDVPDDAQVIEALGVVDREIIFQLSDAILAKDANRLLAAVAEVDARGYDLSDLSSLLVEHFRDLMVAKMVESPSETLLDRSPGEIDGLKQQANTLSRPDLHRYFSLLVSVTDDVSRSRFPRISLEMGLLRLLEVEPAQSLGTLLEKLDAVLVGTSAKASGKMPSSKAGVDPAGGMSGPSKSTALPSTSEHSAKASSQAVTQSVSQRQVSVGSQSATPVAPSGNDGQPKGLSGGDGQPKAPSTEWGELVERVRRQRPALASVLEHGRPVSFAATGVEIAYPPKTFYWESAQERGNRSLLEQALAEHFGVPVTLTLSAANSEAGKRIATIAESEARREKSRDHEIRTDALNHPAVKGAISILGGEIKEVITLEKSEGADESA
ncbi:MAG: DNA polymerase III, subunit gamma and tau [Deltaproteobacteria bacterium RIFOXYA12_FULL_58_15]|nr:MAG: DNA polymerase III, subunit gamma and tau [Deltaproteobacteria bacterium RIFOXYA12_FULL_58_15]OGR11176.1 MAG: DNA polymerase III, subunit gamma and tau [Deltaproteobacteria bacterium RIFOXYB12_FULL_58_9]